MGDSKKSSISKRSSCYLLNLKQPDKTAKRLKLSFQRTAATVSLLKTDHTVEASVGFLDVSETGAGVFTPELLNKGSWVELCITDPVILKVKGIVAWSMPVTSGVHQGKFRCRSGIQFVYDGDAQKEGVKEFMKRASSDPVENMKAAVLAAPPAQMPPGNNTDATLIPPAPEGTPPLNDAPVGDGQATQPVPVSVDTATTAPAMEAPANPVTEVPAMPTAEAAPAPAAEAASPAEAAPVPADSVAGVPADNEAAVPADAPVAEAAPPAAEGSGTPEGGQQAA